MKSIVVFLFFVIVASADKVSYKDYKVFQAVTRSNDDIQFLEKLVDSEDAYSFWDDYRAMVLVNPAKSDEFIKTMNIEGIDIKLIHNDVQVLIDQQAKRSIGDSKFSWTEYHTLEEIYAWLESLSKTYPGIVEIINGGRTYEGRTIKGIRISHRKNNPGIFIESGIHANEWITPATTTYIINEFLTSKDPSVRNLAESHDWYIFPSFNPDGYVYTHNTDRMWRKNRATVDANCCGVDLNRNWDYMWNKIGASNDSCSSKYAGRKPFSEVEAKTMSEYIESIADKLFSYIAFHCFSQFLLIPYGYSTEHLENHNETYAIGKKAIDALSQRYGTEYVVGNTAETIYYAAGISMDWVKGTFKLPIVYTYEFRDQGHFGALLPPEQIIPNAQEVLDSLVVMFDEALKFGYPKP